MDIIVPWLCITHPHIISFQSWEDICTSARKPPIWQNVEDNLTYMNMKDTGPHLLTGSHGFQPGDVGLFQEIEAAKVVGLHPTQGAGQSLLQARGVGCWGGVFSTGGCCQHQETWKQPHGDCVGIVRPGWPFQIGLFGCGCGCDSAKLVGLGCPIWQSGYSWWLYLIVQLKWLVMHPNVSFHKRRVTRILNLG